MWRRGLVNLSRGAAGIATLSSSRQVTVVQSVPTNGIRTFASNPLDAFRDSVDRQTRMAEPVGRSWSAKELRRKSYQDLHKLWYVLYKERNMLLTEQQLSRRRQLRFPQPERMQKVKKSMGAIKQVLGERKRKKIAEFEQSRIEKEMLSHLEDEEEELEMATKESS